MINVKYLSYVSLVLLCLMQSSYSDEATQLPTKVKLLIKNIEKITSLQNINEKHRKKINHIMTSLSSYNSSDIDLIRKRIPVPVNHVVITENGELYREESSLSYVTETDSAYFDEAGNLVKSLGEEEAIFKDHSEPQTETPIQENIIGIDDRRLFNDHTFPFSTIGRAINSNGDICTATVVGPRHILTASHCIIWDRGNGTAGSLRYEPTSYDGVSPFETAWATQYYAYRHIQADGGGVITPEDSAADFAVVVLDRNTGFKTGWMGSKVYTEEWNHQKRWEHVGYPADLGNRLKPSYQSGCFITQVVVYNSYFHRLFTPCDFTPGHSGGPLYGQFEWDGNSHFVIGVGSGSRRAGGTNYFAGGPLITTLIEQARREFP